MNCGTCIQLLTVDRVYAYVEYYGFPRNYEILRSFSKRNFPIGNVLRVYPFAYNYSATILLDIADVEGRIQFLRISHREIINEMHSIVSP